MKGFLLRTSESIKTKVGIAKRRGLRGIAFWRLGLVPEEMWDATQGFIKGYGEGRYPVARMGRSEKIAE